MEECEKVFLPCITTYLKEEKILSDKDPCGFMRAFILLVQRCILQEQRALGQFPLRIFLSIFIGLINLAVFWNQS